MDYLLNDLEKWAEETEIDDPLENWLKARQEAINRREGDHLARLEHMREEARAANKARKKRQKENKERYEYWANFQKEKKMKKEQQMQLELASKKETKPQLNIKPLALASLGTAATISGGAYLYNRYKKKKRAQAEQEKTALLNDLVDYTMES